MEEDVWKELSLSSLHHLHHHHNSTAVPPVSRMTLQEFLAYPSTENAEPKPENGHKPKTPTNPSTSLFACSTGKRDCDVITSEWKRIKLMKNRESAARSRARKQVTLVSISLHSFSTRSLHNCQSFQPRKAYTNELELEVAHLEKENSKLRQELEKLCAEVPGDSSEKKKPKLSRTLTSPF